MSDQPSPEKKAFDYVESLGVHSVYDEALASRKALGDKVMELADLRSRRRTLESLKSDLEMAVVEEERHKHTDMSATAMEKHLKVAFSNNGDIRETRDELIMLAGQIEMTEHDVSLLEHDIRIAAARLHELGGLTNFMAAVKQAETTRKTIENKGPW